ncbi:MAG: aspartate aminotransferase family protein [Thermoleophilia bacterium]
MIDERLVEREAAALMPNYRRQPVAFVRGEGAVLYDAEGNAYLDCMAGISMTNVGHSHPAVVRAITEQAARLINVSNLYYTEPMIELAEWIRDNSLGGRVYFCNSGAEASEAALKLARKRGGPDRPEVVALVEGFHGRTYGALSLTGQASKQEPFRPLVPGVVHVDRDDLEGLRAAVGPRTCAIFLEVIQGEIGVLPVPQAMLELARELADAHGALLVFDEIQTGLSRTGTLFAYQGAGVEPDVMCLAKSLGGGVPIGAVVAKPGIDATFQPGDHGSTFAGGPLACAAGLAACRVLADPALQAHVREVGGRLLDGLRGLVADGLATEARGRGLMCAIDLPRQNAADIVDAMLAERYLLNNTTPRTLRFLPPLVVTAEQTDGLLAALRRTLAAARTT